MFKRNKAMVHLDKMSAYKTKRYKFTSHHTHLKLLACLLSLNASALNAETQHWQSTDYISNSFVEIALKNEYSVQESGVRKWIQPIHYSIVHRTADKVLHQQITEYHLKHLASITGVKIQPAIDNNKANLTIIFSTEKLIHQELKQDFLLQNKQQISELSRNSICLAHFSTYANNSIKNAVVIIPVDRARAHAKLLSCVVEELTQIMGLPNDSDRVFPSIFNDKSHDDYLSGLDFILLKLLYRPEIKVGMNQSQVKKQLVKIMAQDNFQQLLKNSEQLVHQQGLYRLLN